MFNVPCKRSGVGAQYKVRMVSGAGNGSFFVPLPAKMVDFVGNGTFSVPLPALAGLKDNNI